MMRLNFYKTHEDVTLPKFATKNSACFDLCFSAADKSFAEGYNNRNSKFTRDFVLGQLHIMPGDRILIPTGLILDIPKDYSVRLHPRSGLSLKQGLVLANAEGVIDSDYVEEVFIILTNISDNGISIKSGDRICQGELVKSEEYAIMETKDRPEQKTDRNGGMGSTGVSENV